MRESAGCRRSRRRIPARRSCAFSRQPVPSAGMSHRRRRFDGHHGRAAPTGPRRPRRDPRVRPLPGRHRSTEAERHAPVRRRSASPARGRWRAAVDRPARRERRHCDALRRHAVGTGARARRIIAACVGRLRRARRRQRVAERLRRVGPDPRPDIAERAHGADECVERGPAGCARGSGSRSAQRMSARLRLFGLAGVVALLHAVGWGLYLRYSRHTLALAGLGTLAYTFGLRHAFDADHIAAIDNTTRKLLHDGRRPLGVGFFFSLGHSTIVFAVTAGLALTAGVLPRFQQAGSTVGTSVSGTFLLLIGVLNLFVLADIVRAWRELKTGRREDESLDRRLLDRGVFSRFVLTRVGNRIDTSWKMAPLGALFGLGLDTASEIALLALAAGVATHRVPLLAILALPTLFAAGMSLLDTAEGVVMSRAYGWAFSNPVRKLYYNITVTSLSVAVALVVGMIELLRVTVGLRILDLGKFGYVVVALFLATWAISVIYWKARHVEERWTA